MSLSEASSLDATELSATGEFHKEPLRGAQLFEIVPKDQNKNDPIRRPLKHRSADKQATGEAIYIDDIPRMKNELHLAFVTSSKAHARLVNIDATEALSSDEGVIAFYCHKDIEAADFEHFPCWECLLFNRKWKLFFSVYVDDFRMAGIKENLRKS